MKYTFSIITLFLVFLFQNNVFAQNIRLFHIERNKNKNIVCYDLNIKDNTIDKNNPIRGYWKRADGKIEELDTVEKKLAYGIKVISSTATSVTFKLSAYDKQIITVSFDAANKIAHAKVTIGGIISRLSKIYIHANPPLYTSVSYMELFGINLKTGEKSYEKITNS